MLELTFDWLQIGLQVRVGEDIVPARQEKLADGLRMVMSLVSSRIGKSIQDLEQEFGVGRRTVERRLEAIREVCQNFEEVRSDLPPKRWRIRPDRLTRALGLKAEEIAEVEAAAQRLDSEGLRGRATTLRGVANRLRAMMDEAGLSRAEPDVEAQLASEGLAARPGPQVEVDSGIIGTLRGALIASHRIELRYRPNNGDARRYVLEPCGLLYGTRPYLLAVVPGRPDAAVWRLDRVEEVTDTGEGFVPREGFDLATLTASCFGIWREPPQDVVLRFAPSAARDAGGWRFHASQSNEPQPDGSLLVRFRAGGLFEMANHLATWGETVEVQEPAQLREQLAELGRKLVRRHAEGEI